MMIQRTSALLADPALEPNGNFALLLEDEAPRLIRYARRLTSSGADADDLLQDTMLRCWSARASFRPGTNFTAWSRTVMRNAFLSARRRARDHVDLPDEAIDRLLGVAEQQSNVVHLGDARLALGELSNDHRTAVLLIGEGLSYEEGAARVGVSVSTFKSRVVRGRLRLRQLVGDERVACPADDRTVRLATPVLADEHVVGRRQRRRDWTGVIVG